jgi:hypothetical protein
MSNYYRNILDTQKMFKITFTDNSYYWIRSTERTINADARKKELEFNKEILTVV